MTTQLLFIQVALVFVYTAQVHISLKPQDVFTVRRSFSAAQ